MSEIPDYTTGTTPVVTTTEPVAEHTVVTTAENKPNRLYQAAAWVAIVAGTLFIVAVIFFSGFYLGAHSGGHHGWGHGHRDHGFVVHRGGPPMFPMGPSGEFERPMPPFGPGGPNFQVPSPGAPSTTAPARP